MDYRDEHSKPGNSVGAAVSLGAIQGEKVFMQKAADAVSEKLRQHALNSGIPEEYIDQFEFMIRHDDRLGYRTGAPFYATGALLQCFKHAEAAMVDYAQKFGYYERDVNSRTWITFNAKTMRDVLSIYNEGFIRSGNPECCVDFDAIAKECGYDLDQVHVQR